MKILYKSFMIMVTVVLLFPACEPFSYYETDPNNPSLGVAPPSLILTSLIANTMDVKPCWGYQQGWAQMVCSYSDQQGDIYFQGYAGSAMSFDFYGTLRDAIAMEQEGERINTPAYKALANFFKAYCIVDMSMQAGDVPMSDALKGQSESNDTPKYDTQEELFRQAFELLEEANSILADAVTNNVSFGTGDIIYGGSPAKWQKAVNVLRLRFLMNLSKRADDSNLQIKKQFSDIVMNPAKYPLFSSNDDSFVFKYYDKEGNRYLIYYQAANLEYYRIGNTYYNLIKKYNDPRIAIVAERTQESINAEPNKTTFNVNDYGGLNCNDSYRQLAELKDKSSVYNRKRYISPAGEPTIIIGYPEMCFIIAEAINRGWINLDANAYYTNGIKSSMMFYGIDAASITAYVSSAVVAYDGNLEQILNQKYIAFFNNSSWQPFYEMRRTGIPVFQIGNNMSNPSGKVPLRWLYPQKEYQTNESNVKEAIQSQYNGSDGVDDVMWLLK